MFWKQASKIVLKSLKQIADVVLRMMLPVEDDADEEDDDEEGVPSRTARPVQKFSNVSFILDKFPPTLTAISASERGLEVFGVVGDAVAFEFVGTELCNKRMKG